MIRGEIWWVDLGIPCGSEPDFRRPVLIIQDNAFNESRIQTILVLAISYNLELAEAPGNIFLSKKDTQLLKDSVVNVSQIVTLNRERFISREGKLKTKILNEVEEGIKLVIGLS